MQVTATVESFAGKDDAIASIRQAHWACGETDFGGLLALYSSGHIINISDRNASEAFIVDVDTPKPPSGPPFERLPAEEREARMRKYESALDDYKKRVANLDDPAYLVDVSGRIGAEYGVCLQSSSRDPLRRKVFFKIQFRRNIRGGDGPDGGRDLEGRRLRELFEQATGIKADPKMDRAAQVTFGCRISDACPIDVSTWTPHPQPANADYGCTAAKRKKAAQNTSKSEGSQASPPTDAPFQFVPLNMGAYNRRYGKRPREGGRLEWNAYFYGIKGRSIKIIREGRRHATLPRICAAIIWNALFLNNAKYPPISGEAFTPFTLEDCMATLKKIIHVQFDAGDTFWDEEGYGACGRLASLWAEYAELSPEEAYPGLLRKTHAPERHRYVPRDGTAARLFAGYRDQFVQCRSYDEVKDLAGKISLGDEKIMAGLLRRCKNDEKVIKGYGRGGRHANYSEYLSGCMRNKDGRYIVDPAHYHNGRFTAYCQEHGIKIKKVEQLRP